MRANLTIFTVLMRSSFPTFTTRHSSRRLSHRYRHESCACDIVLRKIDINVKEIHSFEPFKETFWRGMANIDLNPNLATKIFAHRFALSDKDEERTIRDGNKLRSATMSIRDHPDGRSMTISVRDAATVLGPIIDHAVANGLMVVAKIDCEGSEYEIFELPRKGGIA